MRTLLIILLFSVTANAQPVYIALPVKTPAPLVTKTEVGLQVIAGFMDGWNQGIVHHHWGQGKWFWDQDSAWRNKYRDWPLNKREAFPGSKSIFVMFTDGNHLTQFFERSALTLSVVLAGKKELNEKRTFWHYALRYGVIFLINRAAFGIAYNLIFTRPK